MSSEKSRSDKDRSRDKDRDRSKDRDAERDKSREKSRDKERDKDKERSRDKDREKDRSRDDKSRDKEREEDRDRRREKERRDSEKDKSDKDRSKDREKERERERERSDKDKNRDKESSKSSRKDDPMQVDKPVVVKTEAPKNVEEPAVNSDAGGGGGGDISLSVEETNKLRAQLGLKPLTMDTGPTEEEKAKAEQERQEAIETAKTIELEAKIEKMRNKRLLTQKIAGKSIADQMDDEDTFSWVEKSRKTEAGKLAQEKELAAQRAKMLEEQEDEEEKPEKYTNKNLAGLKVAHGVDSFQEGHEQILTLKDAFIVGSDGLNEEQDELESVQMSEAQRRKKNQDAAKKKPLFDVYGDSTSQGLLPQYDEAKDDQGTVIGRGGDVNETSKRQLEEIRNKLKLGAKLSYDLETEKSVASEYLTTEEMAKFKKPATKKKKKLRKKEVIQPLETESAESNDHGSRATRSEQQTKRQEAQEAEKELKQQSYDKAVAKAAENSKLTYTADADDEEAEDLYQSLKRAKKAPVRQQLASVADAVAASAERRRNEEAQSAGQGETFDDMVISDTSEFVRKLRTAEPASPTRSTAAVKAERMDIDEGESSSRGFREVTAGDEEDKAGSDKEPDDDDEDDGPADKSAEPLVAGGILATLNLIKSKGGIGPMDILAGRANDKRSKDRDDFSHIRIEHLDEHGRKLTEAQAFRELSYKFHGKKPGKNKQEKRQRQNDEATRRLKMSSVDTPLMTVKAMQTAQAKSGSAYIVLDRGADNIKRELAATAEVKIEPKGGGLAGAKRKAGGDASGVPKKGKS